MFFIRYMGMLLRLYAYAQPQSGFPKQFYLESAESVSIKHTATRIKKGHPPYGDEGRPGQ
jgi:hypothetical protein